MNRKRLLVAAFLVCGALAWLVAILRGRVTSEALHTEYDAEVAVVDALEPPIEGASRERPVFDRAKRDALRERIYRAWGMQPPDERTNPATWPSVPAASGEGFGKDYVRDRIRGDYIPLARDCYQQGLKKNPALAGELVVSFRIVGTKGTGGLIDWVDTAYEDNTLDEKEMRECLEQSMYSVTFDPPPNDGVVTVKVPLVFSPDEPEGGDAG